MNRGSDKMEMERTVEVPPHNAYPAFASQLGLAEWLAQDVRADPQPGGRLYLYWKSGYVVVGEFEVLEPHRLAAFTWRGRGEPAMTRVEVTLAPQRGGAATRIALAHGGLGTGPEWEEPRARMRAGWARALDNLVSVLEEGIDLRLFGRPMLGLAGGVVVTPELAEQRELPTRAGVVLTDFVEGMGAKAAGLRRGDVLVRLAGRDVLDWDTLAAALAACEVGSDVEAAYYRDGSLQETEVTLFGRPRPAVPETAADAAAVLRALHARQRAELADALDGRPAEAMQRRPAAGEWSANEILAHLLTTERAAQLWLSARLQGQEMPNWAATDDAIIRSTTAVWPTTAALLHALDAARAQTAAMLEALPEAFLERRASFVAACDLLFAGLSHHAGAHLTQLRDVVAGPPPAD